MRYYESIDNDALKQFYEQQGVVGDTDKTMELLFSFLDLDSVQEGYFRDIARMDIGFALSYLEIRAANKLEPGSFKDN